MLTGRMPGLTTETKVTYHTKFLHHRMLSHNARAMLVQMLDLDPKGRPQAKDVTARPFFHNIPSQLDFKMFIMPPSAYPASSADPVPAINTTRVSSAADTFNLSLLESDVSPVVASENAIVAAPAPSPVDAKRASTVAEMTMRTSSATKETKSDAPVPVTTSEFVVMAFAVAPTGAILKRELSLVVEGQDRKRAKASTGEVDQENSNPTN
ncbi:hypothetical protein BGX33_001855 [Mortierella sp. NVP41]|nr:hypothetical protein BGX33_001855 [Mortierella sp. NVP41]